MAVYWRRIEFAEFSGFISPFFGGGCVVVGMGWMCVWGDSEPNKTPNK